MVTSSANAIDKLSSQFPEVPRSILIKADVVAKGIKYTPELSRIGEWALPQDHRLFDWDHDDEHSEDQSEKTWTKIPLCFYLKDKTTIMLELDRKSPYEIIEENGGYLLLLNKLPLEDVFFLERPPWYEKKADDGSYLAAFGNQRGWDCFAVCILNFCEYFKTGEQCRFCSIVPTRQRDEKRGVERMISKKIEGVSQAALAAFEHGGICEISITGGGFFDRSKEADLYIRTINAIKKAIGRENETLRGHIVIQAMEENDLKRIHDTGIEAISMNLEVWDEKLFEKICPGKAKHVGRQRWLDSLTNAVNIWGRGKVYTSFVVGCELAAPFGFKSIDEAVASNLEGFEWMLRHDIVPDYLPWSSFPGSNFEHLSLPPTEYYLKIGLGRHRLMMKYDMYPHPTTYCYRDIPNTTYQDYKHLCW